MTEGARGKPDFCFYSPASRGGAGVFLLALAQAMGEAGARVLLISPEAQPASLEPTSPNVTRDILVAGKAGKAPLPIRIWLTLWRILSTFPRLLRARFRTREFVVTFFDWIPVVVAQFLWIRLIRGRLTFIVHDATPHAWLLPSALRGVERWLYRLSYRWPHRIIVLTQALRRELAEDWERSDNVFVIPHGASATWTASPQPGDGVVLVFGMLRRNKRIAESIEAMRLVAQDLPQISLVIAGGPHAEDMGYWQECERALAGLPNIRTEIGFVEEARVRELLAECDALLVPYEDFNSQSGVVVMGCFAERSLLCTDAGGIGELMTMGLEPFVVDRPVSAEGIADALHRFAKTPVEERRAMARRSHERLAERIAWDRIGRDYADLILRGRAPE